MTSTPSAVLSLELQGQNDNTGAWWSNANQIFQSIEDAIAKEVALATTGGDTALSVASYSVDQSRCPIIRIGAGQTLLSLARVTTTRARLYFVTNETSAGSFAVKFGGDVSNLVTIPRNTGAWVRVRSTAATSFAGPLVNLTTGAIDGASLASGAFLLGASNLSDLANAATARTNLGALAASGNLSDLASAATSRVNLGVAIGVNVQAWSGNLDAWSALATSAKQNALGYTPLNVASNLSDLANAATGRTNLGVAYAAKADQQAATSTALVTSPGQQQFHYAHPKAAGVVNGGGGATFSYNVTLVSRISAGLYEITLTAAMADTNYGVIVTPLLSGGTSVAPQVQITATNTFRIRMVVTAGSAVDCGFTFAVIGNA